jgi:hypothetical protein
VNIIGVPTFHTLSKSSMQTTSTSASHIKQHPELQYLRGILAQSRGGFFSFLTGSFDGPISDTITSKAINANKGRHLYPELQYLCNFLNSGKKLF